MATPDRTELLEQLGELAGALASVARRSVENQMQRIDYLGKRLVHPGQRIDTRLEQLSHLGARLRNAQHNQLRSLQLRIDALRSGLASRRPDLARMQARHQDLVLRLKNGGRSFLDNRRHRLEALSAHLDHLNPSAVLARGYSIVTRHDGAIVRDSSELELGSLVDLRLARGRAGARIENKD
jgi:exodeoxyribonuclease VII large subunit